MEQNGTFDMMGNVYEWNETLIGSSRGIRGGASNSSGDDIASWDRSALGVQFKEYWPVGFRVASNVKGGSVSEEIDLLKLADPARDEVIGKWTLSEGNLTVDGTAAARISFPYEPPEEYDFVIEFSVSKAPSCIAQLVCKGEVPFTWSMNAGNPRRCRIEDIDGHSVIGNTTLRPLYSFEAGKKYTLIVEVRNDRVRCLINGELIVEHKTNYSDLSRNKKWTMPEQLRLGLGTWDGPTTFYRIATREVTGKGRFADK